MDSANKNNCEQPYERAKIYALTVKLLRNAHVIVARMNKLYKFSLGKSLTTSIFNLSSNIFIAYEEKDKTVKSQLIDTLKLDLQKILISLRIMYDLQQINKDAYVEIITLVNDIYIQRKQWLAYTIKNQ